MNTQHKEPVANVDDSQWPACSMLFWGIFGTKTPEERRYLTRARASSVVAAVCILLFALGTRLHQRTTFLAITPFVLGTLFTYMAWEFRKYLYTLDELARRLQLEAMAWTYLTGFVLAAWLAGFLMLNHALLHWVVGGSFLLMSPFLYSLLEVVRAGWLYHLSRRY